MSAASAMSKCAVAGCTEKPSPILCGTHWPRVSGDVRRGLVAEFKTLRGRGLKGPPARLLELLGIAVKEATRG